jgi:hypothetical protein
LIKQEDNPSSRLQWEQHRKLPSCPDCRVIAPLLVGYHGCNE